MTKIRVHELAKEFGMASKEMEARVKDLGFNIKNYMSTLEDHEAQEIRRELRGEKAAEQAAEKEAQPRTVVRRKHQVIRLKKVIRPSEPEMEGPALAQASEQKAERPEEPHAVEPVIVQAEAPPQETELSLVTEPQPETPGEPIEPAGPESVIPAVEEPERRAPTAAETEASAAEAAAGPEEARPEPEKTVGPENATPAPGGETTRPEPKTYVKILDRPRIHIPRPGPKTPRPSQQPAIAQEKAAATRGVGPVPSEPDAASIEKKGKKKTKRVVQISDMDGQPRRRRAATAKRKEKLKPINKLIVEEVEPVATPISEEEWVSDLDDRRAGRPGAAPKPGTARPKAAKRRFAIYETIQVGDLAKRMGIKVGDVILKLMGMGIMVTANQAIDFDVASVVASDFDYEVEKKAVAEDMLQIEDTEMGEPKLRPPVVTVMGHVDHGKTSLLDAIRHADVASGEAGGITQHIGAYHVTLPSGNEVVFLDTPGHEAFTAMRARGAKVTDIVILVVAADDGVMAQTREAVDHSKAAGVPIIVAVNKIDKAGANPDRVKSELAELGLVPEEWGGDTIFVNISAKQKTGIEELLEMLALQAEVLELKADPSRPARGHVVEAQLDKGRGPVATLLVSEGTLRTGDALVCGIHHGRIRAMISDKGEQMEAAGPSMPVEIQGLSGVPEAGNEFSVLPDEKKAREVAEYRQRKAREIELIRSGKMSLDNVFERFREQELKELNLVLKTDVQGSMEALAEALRKLSTQDIKVNIVRSGIGAIAETDVLLASASNAIVLGFNVRPSTQAKSLAEREQVEIRFYDVIYKALEDVRSAMVGLLEPVYEEKTLGHAEVRQTFHVPKVGTVAGCYVQDGVIQRNAQVRLLRENVVVYTGKISSLRRFKDDVREVQTGYECGIGLEKFNDVKVGDVIEVYRMEEVAPVLGESLAESALKRDENEKGQNRP